MLSKQNALSQQLEKLYHCWNKETSGKESKLFRWVVKQDEISMVEGFYAIEASDKGVTEDIFLKFCSPFESGHTYSKNLTEEFKILWEKEKNTIADNGGDYSFNFISGLSLGDRDVFFQNILRFSNVLQINRRIILYLAPTEIKKVHEFELWLINAVKLHLPNNCCLMIINLDEMQVDKKQVQHFMKEVVWLRPDLQLRDAFAQFICEGGSDDINSQFRQSYFQLTDAVFNKNYLTAQNIGNELIKLISPVAWASMRISVRLMMANACIEAEKFNKAIGYYKAGCIEAENIQKTDALLGIRLRIICLIGWGNGYVFKKQYNNGTQCFRLAGSLGFEIADFMFAMEGFRMAGFCYQKMGIRHMALECYRNAFEAGQQLESSLQHCITFLMVGRQLSTITNLAEEKITTRRKMVELMGSDWELKYQQLKQA